MPRLGGSQVPSWWEVDDVIFDEPVYRANGNLDSWTRRCAKACSTAAAGTAGREGLACDKAIASTDHLAAVMRQAGVPETLVVENALDAETLEAAALLRVQRAARAERATCHRLDGSGTKTHDVDFARAAPALIPADEPAPRHPLARIVGELTLPPGIDAFGARSSVSRQRITGPGSRCSARPISPSPCSRT